MHFNEIHTQCFPRDYGLTDHNGKHRLRGPGLDEKIGQGGVSAMGGKWPVDIFQGFQTFAAIFLLQPYMRRDEII